MTPAKLRDRYQDQIRARVLVRDPEVETVHHDGPLCRKESTVASGFITYRDLDGLDGPALDRLIAAQRDRFTALGQAVEWKYHDYDLPADLPDRLRAAGFRPDEPEALVLGETADLVIANRLPYGVTLREITERSDLERLRDMQATVWDDGHDWLPDALSAELGSDTDPVRVIVAEADGRMVCGSWVRLHTGTDFASLWGGSTLPQWRGRGIYRATVARRAQLALAAGFGYLQVDCSPDSRPILERLGMHTVATTTPYMWKPQKSS